MRLPAWTLALAALVALGYALPYTLLAGRESWGAAFLFWLVFGLGVWAILVAVVLRWDAGASRAPGERRR